MLQKRNTEFFSLEYCCVVAIIRDAMAGHKTDTFGHNPILPFSPLAPSVPTTNSWGSNESAQE
jgi:hypothetical protein